jgi:hypothetical protein
MRVRKCLRMPVAFMLIAIVVTVVIIVSIPILSVSSVVVR